MTHPKPDNAPTSTGPVLSALEAGWLGEILRKNKEFMDEVPESLGGTGLVIKELRALLVQRDKRVEELEARYHNDIQCRDALLETATATIARQEEELATVKARLNK